MENTGAMMQDASYKPFALLREVAVDAKRAVLLFVDTQNYNCHKAGAMYRRYTLEALEGPDFSHWWHRVNDCNRKWARLQQAARACGMEVMYTVTQSLTADGRDRSLEHKISGYHVPPACWDAEVVESIAPRSDEVVLPKSSSSVFKSTTLDYMLRNMDKRFLIIAGCSIDQSLAHAVKGAADLGYMVTLVSDCCAALSADRHTQACEAVGSCCRQRTLESLLEELSRESAKTDIIFKEGGIGAQTRNNAAACDGGGSSGKLVASIGALGGSTTTAGATTKHSEDFARVGGRSSGSKRTRVAARIDRNTKAGRTGGPRLGIGGKASDDDRDNKPGHRPPTEDAESSGEQGRSRGPTSRRQAETHRQVRDRSPGSDHRQRRTKGVYFEYAKPCWETETEFALPNGTSWVDVAVPGDPKKGEGGLVYCRLCRYYNKDINMARGYRLGKRSALKEHQDTRAHKESVQKMLEDGLNIKLPKDGPELPPPPPPLPPAAAAATTGLAPASVAAATRALAPSSVAAATTALAPSAVVAATRALAPSSVAAATTALAPSAVAAAATMPPLLHAAAAPVPPLAFVPANTAAASTVPAATASDLMAAAAAIKLGLMSVMSGTVSRSSDDSDSHLQPPDLPPPAAAAAAAAADGGTGHSTSSEDIGQLMQLAVQAAALAALQEMNQGMP